MFFFPSLFFSLSSTFPFNSSSTSFFHLVSPEGRLYQVEYAIAAIQNAAACVGVQTKDGIVVCVERKVTSKLLAPTKSSDKVFKVDAHVFAAVAGLTADANILVNYARLCAQRYRYTYQEPQPVEALVQLLCDYKHSYTQYGGLRPFGVAFLYAGWDEHHGFQLYQSDPSGNYSGWKATAIGGNSTSAVASLKSDYSEDLTLSDATKLALKVLTKAMDTTAPTADKVEVVLLSRAKLDEQQGMNGGKAECIQRVLSNQEVNVILKEIAAQTTTSGDV